MAAHIISFPIVDDGLLINDNHKTINGQAAETLHTGCTDHERRGTLADAQTTIEELYEWQTNGPFRYDFCGNAPQGRPDAGAIEYVER